MPHYPTLTEVRSNNISKRMAITVNTLDVLVNTLNVSGLEAISNTTQSLLGLMETIKQDKSDCVELMEHTHQFLNAIIGVYIKSDTGAELPPSTLNQIAKFTETLHKIHTFVEAQQSGSKIKKFFRQGELSVLLKGCKEGLQQGLDFFQLTIGVKFKMTADLMVDATKLHDQAQFTHQEVLNIIETMSSSDSASSISRMYSGSYTSSNSISMLPAEPKIFHGRNSELVDILNLFSQGTPRIVILGAGGMGKTSLAKIALHHEQITTKYQANRLFVACDTASSKVELAGLIGAHLGMKPGKDLTQAVLQHFTNAPPSLLILDNLETVWEPVTSRTEIEVFLSMLTDNTNLALLVTMRGAERPEKVQWTRPFLSPLGPLSQEAARKMFIDVADDKHSIEEVDQVLHLTDNMPLAISLLAHLADMEDCSTILSRWETEKTLLISDGHDKRSNLELSIYLSLSSPRITSVPHSQDLLALLSILPDGLSDVELKQSKFPIQDILGCKTTLLRTALAYTDNHNRLKVLVPVREYMARCCPPTDNMIRPLLMHFHELLELHTTVFGKESGALPIARITSNYTNIQNVLQYGLRLEHPDIARSIYCACDFNQFSRLIGQAATVLMKKIKYLLPSLYDHRPKTYFIVELFNSSLAHSISEPEMLIAQALDDLKHFNDPALEARFHEALGWYYYQHTQNMPKAVEHSQIALLLAQTNDDYKGQSSTLGVLSNIEWLGGNYTVARAYAREAQRLAKLSGELFQEAIGLYYEQNCEQVLGDYASCILLCTRARTLLGLCGMPHGDLNYAVMNLQAEVHLLKSEYAEGHLILNQNLQKALGDQNLYIYGITLVNLAEIEVFMGGPTDEIQRKIDTSKAILERQEARSPGYEQQEEYKGGQSRGVFVRYRRSAWDFSDITKQRLTIYKAFQFLGDVFLKEDDEVTATSLCTLALEGFTRMDVHRSRAECMIRLGDISQKDSDLLKALKLWETARPLFERSLQSKRVQDIEERLTGIDEQVKQQHRLNLTQLAGLNTPVGKIEDVEEDSSDGSGRKKHIGLVVA
ncbi:hypothetical protein B0H16DRAFT_1696911 [Mycena metata]|uniref:Novel STAND NTPase 1 domain-containing protein n=1 Tax=Mycena metata TaxID=1033252 RepID=A0AAD7HZI9_9AGAR|nr:hypothetical protein B0H16DRAFT_1696911 [Mycena metata]